MVRLEPWIERARPLVALALLAAIVSGCGRLGFETAGDASCTMAPAPSNLCTDIPTLATQPVIDGHLDSCLTLTPIAPTGWTGSLPMPTIAARAAVAWRRDGLYVYVEVDDANLFGAAMPVATYCGDGIEIYVDDDGAFAMEGAYDRPGTVQLIAAAPTSTGGMSSYGERFVLMGMPANGAWANTRFAMVGRPNGYALETFVQAADLGLDVLTLNAGQHIGLDLSINVSTTDGSPGTGTSSCGTRIGQYFLHVVPPMGMLAGQPFRDTRAFCTPTLR